MLTDALHSCEVMGSRFLQMLHIIIVLQIVPVVTGQYKIIPPEGPVIGVVGRGVILPCQLKVDITPQKLAVQWTFTGSTARIEMTSYDGKIPRNPILENKAYQGRTEFFQLEFIKGNVSLHLKGVQLSDRGQYSCSVFFENWYDEVVLDLHVAAEGDEASVFLDGPVGWGIGLTCKSQGWFPEPEVVWMNSKGPVQRDKVTTQNIRTSSGVFDVVSSMTLQPGSDKEVSCRIVNNLLNTSSESRVLISGDFFPSTSPWMTAFLVMFPLSAALLGVTVYKLLRSLSQAREAVRLRSEKTAEKVDLEDILATHRGVTEAALNDHKCYLERFGAEMSFWKARDYAVAITVTPDCRVLQLQLPGAPDVQSSTSAPAAANTLCTVPVLLGKEGFAAGIHYWEVKVTQQQDWVLGVLRDKGRQEQEGSLVGEDSWALHSSQGQIFSREGVHRIEQQQLSSAVVGVLLDLEEGQVNFYEAEQKVSMVRMPLRLEKKPTEKFYPFVAKGQGTSMPLIHPVLIPAPLQLSTWLGGPHGSAGESSVERRTMKPQA